MKPLDTSEQAAYRLLRLFSKVRARSFRCSSFPNRTRFAGLRFGFGCRPENWSLETVRAFHVGAKSALLRRSFIPMEQKNVIRPLPCSSFPTAIRSAGFRFGLGTDWDSVHLKCSLFPRRSKVRFAPTFFYSYGTKERHPPAPLLLLSNRDSLHWIRGWCWVQS